MTSPLTYGESQIQDPRNSETVWPWTLNIAEHVEDCHSVIGTDCRLTLKLTGIPYLAPVVG